mmetsp:Transcript_139709/g.243255  ORF Transcript_139709/g.243255 Transcript_139709/m.243255 type:complete len:233 (-) Transcript_139709:426-1124(-)
MLDAARAPAKACRNEGLRRIMAASAAALTAMPTIVQRPIATPPCAFTTAPTRMPPTDCSATGAMVRSRQPWSSALLSPVLVAGLPTRPMEPRTAASGAPQRASSKVNSVLGRAPTRLKASCDKAAARPEHTAVAMASARPDATTAACKFSDTEAAPSFPAAPEIAPGATLLDDSNAPLSLPLLPPSNRFSVESGTMSSAPAATAQKSAKHCRGVCPSPSRNQAATAQNTVLV